MVKQNRVIELDDIRTGSASTEEFLAQIHRSTALMRENRSEEAKKILEEAFQSRQDDPSSQATLGLVYFKLGIYPRAEAIYRQLVKSFPEEPTLRLNLGLVYLKTGQNEQAVRELEAAVHLAPDYRKANGYLGLAYQRHGDYLGAKRAFERAGAHHLAEQMSRYIPTSNTPEQSECLATDAISGETGEPQISEDEEQEISLELAGFVDELPFLTSPALSMSGTTHLRQHPVSISEFSAMARLGEPHRGPFFIAESGHLLVSICSRGFTRLEGLHFLTAEQIVYKPLQRRCRGKSSGDELFGGRENPMFEVVGNGRLAFHPAGSVFNAVVLDVESVFVREGYLFAIETSLSYENGQIPVHGGRLVHLSGRGAFALKTPGTIQSLDVTPRKGVILPAEDLVGWFGRMLPTPATQSPFDASLEPIELTGEGVVLFCLS